MDDGGGSGILHEEFHSPEFTKTGGTLEMVQLWVNLPAQDKLEKPGYQTLLDADIPSVDLPDDAGRVRVIAGEFGGRRGPARTFTPIDVWDVRSATRARRRSSRCRKAIRSRSSCCTARVKVNGKAVAHDAQMVLLDRAGTDVVDRGAKRRDDRGAGR